jgi:hypothetical protein
MFPVLLAAVAAGPASAEVLISQEEAALPPSSSPVTPGQVRGVSRPPLARLEPQPAKAPTSPITFKVTFVSYGRTKIDPAATRVTYLKNPLIDLTPRLKRYIQATGIDMPNAEIPPGEHPIMVELTDSNGHTAVSVLTLVVGR